MQATPADNVEAVESEEAGKILPKIVSQPAPAFPASLARAGVGGRVMVTFTVDASGNVRDAEVTSSEMHQLNLYALKAVEAWKFIPGTRNGQASNFRLRSAVEFSLKGASRAAPGNAPGSGTEAKTDHGPSPSQSALAAPIQPSTSPSTNTTGTAKAADAVAAFNEKNPSVKRKVAPVYPYDMLISGQTGWADAEFVVDYTGRPLFTNSGRSSNHAFALAVVAMVEASAYNPVHKGKSPVMSGAKEHFDFTGETSLDPEARRILKELRKSAPQITSSNELDERPKVIQQAAPVYPRALRDDGLTGQAEIEFIIDREGRVLFPRIISASHEDFGWAAATAVAQWRFQPPIKSGRAVEARMSVPVLFTAQKLAESD